MSSTFCRSLQMSPFLFTVPIPPLVIASIPVFSLRASPPVLSLQTSPLLVIARRSRSNPSFPIVKISSTMYNKKGVKFLKQPGGRYEISCSRA